MCRGCFSSKDNTSSGAQKTETKKGKREQKGVMQAGGKKEGNTVGVSKRQKEQAEVS